MRSLVVHFRNRTTKRRCAKPCRTRLRTRPPSFRPHFVILLFLVRCAAGDPDAARERLEVLDSLEFIATSPSVDELARKLIEEFAVPKTEPRDAVHISLAAINGQEYLVSWNFKHIVNPTTRSAIERVCRDAGFVPPMICTPDELMEA